ncbi:hypothetical protein BRAO375_2870002 [Bradyrhizobium sp. ORS 375]|nr:hypothetical protein BRAO375_2870002 [Bradyrhizobium sp. ORS 375]
MPNAINRYLRPRLRQRHGTRGIYDGFEFRSGQTKTQISPQERRYGGIVPKSETSTSMTIDLKLRRYHDEAQDGTRDANTGISRSRPTQRPCIICPAISPGPSRCCHKTAP